jgi:uncharacterized protein
VLLLDANILLYAFRKELPQHARARAWLLQSLTGRETVGVPTLSETAFLRLATKRLGPLEAATWDAAWDFISRLLEHRPAQRVTPGTNHPEIFDRLARRYGLHGDATIDGWLAALAIERGATFVSADGGFERFKEMRWLNPLRPEP